MLRRLDRACATRRMTFNRCVDPAQRSHIARTSPPHSHDVRECGFMWFHEQPWPAESLPGPCGSRNPLADDNAEVIVDHQDVVGRRRRHQAGMRRRRPQGQRSPLWPWLAAAWSQVPRSRRLECAVLGAVQTLSTICNAYVTMTRATSRPQCDFVGRVCGPCACGSHKGFERKSPL